MAKAYSMAALLALLAAAFLMIMAEPGQAAVDCGQARSQLSTCAAYLTGDSTDPQPSCCSGVRSINENAVSQADRRSTCQCLKDTALGMANLKDAAAQQLPDKCGVHINVPISRTIDCNNI